MLRKRKLLAMLKFAARGPSKREVQKVYKTISELDTSNPIAFAYLDYERNFNVGYGMLRSCVKPEESISSIKGPYYCARTISGELWRLEEKVSKSGKTFIFGTHDHEAVEVRDFEAGTYYLPVVFSNLIKTMAEGSGTDISGICLFKVDISPPANLDKNNIVFISSSDQIIDVSEQIKKFEEMDSSPQTDKQSEEYKTLKMMHDMFGQVLEKKYPEKAISVNILLGKGDYTTAEGARDAVADGDKVVQVKNKGVSTELKPPIAINI